MIKSLISSEALKIPISYGSRSCLKDISRASLLTQPTAYRPAKLRGINHRIKTLRRQAYGIPDDEYFFLKVIDASHKPYVRNPKSHKFLH